MQITHMTIESFHQTSADNFIIKGLSKGFFFFFLHMLLAHLEYPCLKNFWSHSKFVFFGSARSKVMAKLQIYPFFLVSVRFFGVCKSQSKTEILNFCFSTQIFWVCETRSNAKIVKFDLEYAEPKIIKELFFCLFLSLWFFSSAWLRIELKL